MHTHKQLQDWCGMHIVVWYRDRSQQIRLLNPNPDYLSSTTAHTGMGMGMAMQGGHGGKMGVGMEAGGGLDDGMGMGGSSPMLGHRLPELRALRQVTCMIFTNCKVSANGDVINK